MGSRHKYKCLCVEQLPESRSASFIVHISIILVERCVKMWVCVRRPSGNRRPSAISYKSYLFFSLLLWSRLVSQTLQRSRTVGRFHMGHAARIHEHTHANKGSDSQRAGQNPQFSYMTSVGAFQNLAWWLTNTGLSAQWKGWCSKIHFCLHSQKEMLGWMFEKLFFMSGWWFIKLQQTKKA